MNCEAAKAHHVQTVLTRISVNKSQTTVCLSEFNGGQLFCYIDRLVIPPPQTLGFAFLRNKKIKIKLAQEYGNVPMTIRQASRLDNSDSDSRLGNVPMRKRQASIQSRKLSMKRLSVRSGLDDSLCDQVLTTDMATMPPSSDTQAPVARYCGVRLTMLT